MSATFRRHRRGVRGLEVLVIDALQYRTHPSSFVVRPGARLDRKARPQKAVLTHMHVPLDYAASVAEETPDSVQPAYDGMIDRNRLFFKINVSSRFFWEASIALRRQRPTPAAGLPIESGAWGPTRTAGSCAANAAPLSRQIVKSLDVSRAARAAGSIFSVLPAPTGLISGKPRRWPAKGYGAPSRARRRSDRLCHRRGGEPIGHFRPSGPLPTGGCSTSIASGQRPEPTTPSLPPIRRRWLRQLTRRSPRSQSDNARRRA